MVTILNTPYQEKLEHPFKFELDDFQKHAIHLMNTIPVSNILITAHTGSGKSLPAEYAILKAHELGKKSIYCSPIKTLSNQKFFEFTKKFPEISIGILTGDNKHNPMAECLIMTTEILMIMLSKNELKIDNVTYEMNIKDEVYSIIFDEVHYINDQDRGKVWERSIMTVPPNINILMLSATINKPENFLSWVHSCNNNPSFLLSNERRVVPLRFAYAMFVTKLPKVLEPHENFLNRHCQMMETTTKTLNDDIVNRFMLLTKHFEENKTNLRWLINEICKYLKVQNMCPAIFFVFSKKNCISLAESISEHFNDDNETREVEHQIKYYLAKLEHKDDYMKTKQYYEMLDLAKKGIAVHHSGLIPVFKEIVEMLFSRNLIKILFATETFSVGLNMPTKTVIFTDVFKYDNNGKRMLYAHEFIQMSGRAGRRGLDTVGHVLLLPQIFTQTLTRTDLRDLMLGSSQTIKSKFKIDANLVLNFMKKNEFKQINDFVKNSMLYNEVEKQKKYIQEETLQLEEKIKPFTLTNKEIYDEYDNIKAKLSDFIKPSNKDTKKYLSRIKEIESSKEFKAELETYKTYKIIWTDIMKNYKYLESMETMIDTELKNQIKYLEMNGYFNPDTNELTVKGQIGLVFRELDSIIGSEIICNEYTDTLDDIKYISLLTMITEGKNDKYIEIPETHLPVYSFITKMFPDIQPNREYVYAILDWYHGKHISEMIITYEIFEGDLIKTVNKIINFIDELNEGYIINNNLKIVDMLTKIKIQLTREIISTESLYLKL
jgi:superfamily II RNA helicase